jgi:chemotaxis-related protein WspD
VKRLRTSDGADAPARFALNVRDANSALGGEPASCWQQIGIWGNRSCPELLGVTHCHNCPVFAAAGRRFLDAPSPPDYLDEWTARLSTPDQATAEGETGVLVFRLGDEWLALTVDVLVEVTKPRKPHRVPHRAGLLAGVVNVRGELRLCVRLDLLLGIDPASERQRANPRLVVIHRDSEGWVFQADEVDQVQRISARDLTPTPPTLTRSSTRLTRGIVVRDSRSVGVLDEARMFHALRERLR